MKESYHKTRNQEIVRKIEHGLRNQGKFRKFNKIFWKILNFKEV